MPQFLTRFFYSLNPLRTGGDGHHPEALPAKPRAVKVLRPGRFVGEQFSLQAGLVKVATRYGHRAPVSF